MTFKIKALAAAAAFVVAGAANADIVDFNEAGGGSLLLSVWNATDAVSALFDLGPTMDTFNGNASQAWNLAGGDYAAAWASFAPSLSGATFMVFAGDVTGTAWENNHFLSTVASGSVALTNQQVKNMGELNGFVAASEAQSNHGQVADGANFSDDPQAYQGTAMADNWKNGVPFISTAAVGNAVAFYDFQGVAASGRSASATAAEVTEFAGTFTLNADGSLQYAVAAIPEPESYALMLAGLGLIGAVVRRRSAR